MEKKSSVILSLYKPKIGRVTAVSNFKMPSQYFQFSNSCDSLNFGFRTKVGKKKITTKKKFTYLNQKYGLQVNKKSKLYHTCAF